MIIRWLNTFYDRRLLGVWHKDDILRKLIESIEYEMCIHRHELSAELVKGSFSQSLSFIRGQSELPCLVGILYKRSVLRKYYKKDVNSSVDFETGRKKPHGVCKNLTHYESFIKVDSSDEIIGILLLSQKSIDKYLEGNPRWDKRRDELCFIHDEIKEYAKARAIKVISKDIEF